MSDPRHRRPDRRRGVRLRSSAGRRRATVEERAPTRAELREAAAARRRRAQRRNIGLAVVAAIAMVAAAVLATSWLDRDDESTTTTVAVDVPEEGASTLVAVLDDDDRAMAIALFAAGSEAGERVVLLQPSLLTTLPGFGENVLSNAVRFEDAGLLASSVANLLGSRIDNVLAVTDDELAASVEGTITVDLPVPFIVADGTAQVVIAGTGPVGRDGAMIARLLTEPGLSDEFELLERQGAVWEALLATPDVLVALGGGEPRVEETLLSVAQGDPLLTSVPATRIEPSGDEERYQLDGVDAAAFTEAQFPYLQLAPEPRVRVEVLNGNGLIGTTRPVAERLIDFGFRVVFTDNADRSDYAQTLIIAQGRQFQQAALTARDAMRIGEVSVELRQPSGVVDLTIIVGQDLPAGG